MPNRLLYEKSPYLLQHADNPVDWYPWGDEAFRRAEEEDKPVLLSIGYSTCHWCHVMAHESFEDEEVAALLKQDYICIKVDREERPDVDSVYMSVCQGMTGSGGWPLTILMTPQKKPFFAATYLPRNSTRYQYGLMELLKAIAKLWREDREKILHTGDQVVQALHDSMALEDDEPDRSLAHRAYHAFAGRYDEKWGGFGRAPKFPSPHNLLFLMRYAQAEHQPEALRMVEKTLDAMARGGIHDHIGGGFSRYSTEEKWLIPHFEKMLYDQALLLLAYVTAYQMTKNSQYADVAHRTADYVLRELTDESGGFYCGQDADSEGVEGKYYVFTPEEIRNVLGRKDAKAFCELYGITSQGNFEGKSIPNRIGQIENGWGREDERLGKLREYRLQRTALHKDDKILLSWNAWMILAMAKAGSILGEERYLNAALRAEAFLHTAMTDERDRLYLRYRDGEAAHAGQLEDYAVYALALLELYRATLSPYFLQAALRRAEQMCSLFEGKENGGYYMTAADAEQLIARPKETYDGAVPSGNTAAAMALQQLASLTGETVWMKAAQRQLRFLAGSMEDHPQGCSFGLLAMMDALYPHRELVCASADGLPDELAAYLKEHPSPDLSILLKTPDNAQALAACAPFTRDYPLPEQGAMYYLCENGACQAPVTDFTQLPLP